MNNTNVSSDLTLDKIHPTKGQLLLEYQLPEQKTASGIILVSDSTDKTQKNYVGRIIATGEGVPEELEPCKTVIFKKGRQYDLFMKPTVETGGFPSHCLVSYYDVEAIVEGEGTVFCN